MNPRIVGRVEVAPGSAKCIDCGEPFKGGNKGEPGVNVYSKDGMREIAITGMCEACFDALMDDGDAFEGQFCGGCSPEPTISELEDGRCDACGKEIA